MAENAPVNENLCVAAEGENARVLREILAQNPTVGNQELAEMYLLCLRSEGCEQAPDFESAVQAVIQAKLQHCQGEDHIPEPPGSADRPSLEDLLRIKELASQAGGIDSLAAKVQEVEAIALQVGGVDRLKAGLDGLRQLLDQGAAVN